MLVNLYSGQTLNRIVLTLNIGLLHKQGMLSCNGGKLVSGSYPTGIGSGVMYNAAIYWSGQGTWEMYDRACIVSYKENPDVNKNK